MIWEYGAKSILRLSPDEDARFRRSYYSETTPQLQCHYCQAPMTRLDSERSSMMGQAMPTLEIFSICGWWVVTDRAGYSYGYEGFTQIGRAAGILRELHQDDLSLPIEELTKYLVVNYESRSWIHPRRYEEIVGAVFAGLGYQVRVTSYSGDDDIDVFVFDGADDHLTGVQIKRYQGKIQAKQSRSFAGALVLNGLTSGST